MRPEPADVLVIDGRPGRFVWRGRLYTVLAVLERPAPEGGRVASGQAGEGTAGRAPVGEGQAEPGELAAPAWRCWRVMASPGKNVPAASFRLCQQSSTDRWLLTRGDE